jgi:hypothetical protein
LIGKPEMANNANAAVGMVDEDGIGCQLSFAGPERDGGESGSKPS